MLRSCALLFLLVTSLVAAACSGSATSTLTTPGSCVAGTTEACVCPGGAHGLEVCGDSGAFLECICGAGQADGGPSDGAADATIPCTPNNAVACAGKCGQLKNGCGTVVACGGCSPGETCGGGGGANLCGSGACTPSCAGKACGASDGCGGACSGAACGCTPDCSAKPCGASDGCGGTCQNGACPSGLNCQAGACACDGTSCSGCCSAAGQCESGGDPSACGSGGSLCAACGGGTSCDGTSCNPTCQDPGGTCATSGDCCAGSECSGTTCAVCGDIGADCGPNATAGCCAGKSVSCEGPGQTCCGQTGAPCQSAGDCCGTAALTCGAAGTCEATSASGPGIVCGSALCTAGVQYCCDGRTSSSDTFTCDALPLELCYVASLACDDQTDCPTGQFCCARPSQLSEFVQWTATCETSCSGGTTGDGTTPGERLCNPSAAVDECASIPGKSATCKPWIGIDQAESACDCGATACYP